MIIDVFETCNISGLLFNFSPQKGIFLKIYIFLTFESNFLNFNCYLSNCESSGFKVIYNVIQTFMWTNVCFLPHTFSLLKYVACRTYFTSTDYAVKLSHIKLQVILELII